MVAAAALALVGARGAHRVLEACGEAPGDGAHLIDEVVDGLIGLAGEAPDDVARAGVVLVEGAVDGAPEDAGGHVEGDGRGLDADEEHAAVEVTHLAKERGSAAAPAARRALVPRALRLLARTVCTLHASAAWVHRAWLPDQSLFCHRIPPSGPGKSC